MRETGFGQEVAELWAFGLALCDLLGEDPPAMLEATLVMEEARGGRDRDQLSPAAQQKLTALEQFIEECRGRWDENHPKALLDRADDVQQCLAVAEITAMNGEEAGYWRGVLEAHVHTAHPDLPSILEQAEAYLARSG